MSSILWETEAIALIKEFEGLRLKPYQCPGGYTTIGYGHVILDHEKYDYEITNSIAEYLLEKDIAKAHQALNRLVKVPLNPHQQAALVSFIFNVGAGRFQASTLRQVLNRREYDNTAKQLLKWTYAAGRPLKGLERRRQAEMALFLKKDVMPARQEQENQKSHYSWLKQAAALFIGGLKTWNH